MKSKYFLLLITTFIGITSVAAEVRSSFNEVWKVIFTPPAAPNSKDIKNDLESYGTHLQPQLPHFSGSADILWSLFTRALEKAARRTVNEKADYRDYFKKLVHANGTCFAGNWIITSSTPYSGLFATGSEALMIGRISTANPVTESGSDRSFGFAGKLFPTTNVDEVVSTADFFSVDNLNGTNARHALDVAFTNEPPVDLGGRFSPIRLLNNAFEKADVQPGMRPLWPIANAGIREDEKIVSPKWMRLKIAPGIQKHSIRDKDFRTELSPKNYPQGLSFTIEVSNTTKDPLASSGWEPIGIIRSGPNVVTFGCDRRLHFNHPKVRNGLPGGLN